jgi:8-oxo-dGTP diphosphatase
MDAASGNHAPVDELVRELNLSRTTIYRLIRQHHLTTYKRPGDRRTWIDRDQLVPYLGLQPKATSPTDIGERRLARGHDTAEPSVAACYIVKDGRLLMVRRIKQDGGLEWAGPSGQVEPGETPEEAVVREVREEVGLNVVVERRLGDRVHPATGRHLVYLACRIVSGTPALVADREISAIEWCDLATVKERWADLRGGIFPPVLRYLEETMTAPGSAGAGDTALPFVASAIVVRDGRVLMTRRRFREGPLLWNFVTGQVESGETPAEAVVREALEEVGLTVAVQRQIGERVHPASGRHMVYFACRVVGGTAGLVDHEENAEVRWATLAEAEGLLVPTGGVWGPVRAYLEEAGVEIDAGQSAGGREQALKPLAAAVIVRGDRALLTERRYPGHGEQWSWPSGKIERDESLQDAILRELHEELLITDARVVSYLGDINLPSGYRMSHFHVDIPADAEPKLNDYEQLVGIEWMTRDEAKEAFRSLTPEIADRALVLLDRVLAEPAGPETEADVRARRRAERLAWAERSTASPPSPQPGGDPRSADRPRRP